MKKSDLKVGVEYACHMRPGAARSRYSREPFKATLVSTSFSEYRVAPNPFGASKRSMVGGIAVDSGKAVEVVAHIQVRDAQGNPKMREATASEKKFRSGPRRMTKKRIFKYDYVLLETAACFVSTWEDYLVEKQAREDHSAAELAQREAREKSRDENEPKILARIEQVLDCLRKIGSLVLRDDYAGDPRFIEVRRRSDDSVIIQGEITYGIGRDKKRVTTGIELETGLEGTTALLGI